MNHFNINNFLSQKVGADVGGIINDMIHYNDYCAHKIKTAEVFNELLLKTELIRIAADFFIQKMCYDIHDDGRYLKAVYFAVPYGNPESIQGFELDKETLKVFMQFRLARYEHIDKCRQKRIPLELCDDDYRMIYEKKTYINLAQSYVEFMIPAGSNIYNISRAYLDDYMTMISITE